MKIKQLFHGEPPREYRREFEQGICTSFRMPMVVMSILISLFELYMLVTVFLMPGPVNSTPNRFTFFLCYLSLLLVTVTLFLVLLLADRYFKRNPSVYLSICFFYSLFICMWGAFLSGYSHRNAGDISVFLYISLCVAVLVPMKPHLSIIVFSAEWVVLYVAVQQYISPEVDPFPSLLNGAFTALVSMALAIILYRNRISNFLDRKTILLQNRQIQKMNERLSAIVLIDELTQIYNRRYLEKELPSTLEQARERGVPIALYMIDIDSFKQFNTLYGHQEGDACLRQVANIIGKTISKWDTHLLRYGGEEFVVLAIDIEPEDAETLGESIRQNVEQRAIPHFDLPGGVVTVSVGACRSRGDGDATLTQLIHYADIAMYTAKTNHKNRVEFYGVTAEK